MTATYTPISSQTLSVDSGTITIENIPQTFGHLILTITGRVTTSNTFVSMRFNGTGASSNYWYTELSGDGASLTPAFASPQNQFYIGTFDSARMGSIVCDIYFYSVTDGHTVITSKGGNANNRTSLYWGRWSQTPAISSVYLFPSSGNFTANTRVTLYGLVA